MWSAWAAASLFSIWLYLLSSDTWMQHLWKVLTLLLPVWSGAIEKQCCWWVISYQQQQQSVVEHVDCIYSYRRSSGAPYWIIMVPSVHLLRCWQITIHLLIWAFKMCFSCWWEWNSNFLITAVILEPSVFVPAASEWHDFVLLFLSLRSLHQICMVETRSCDYKKTC